jgi:hypothetical protein
LGNRFSTYEKGNILKKEVIFLDYKIRFIRVFDQHRFGNIAIWVDRETGVNYLSYDNEGKGGGLTVLLDKDGKPVVTPTEQIQTK